MSNKKGGQKELERKLKATSKYRQTSSPSARYGLSEIDLEQAGECTDFPGPRYTASSPVESEGASDACHDSSPIPEDHLKLEMALQSVLLSTPHKPEASAITGVATPPVEHESRNDLSELKEMIKELKKDIQRNMKKEISDMIKTNEKLCLELRQDNKDLEMPLYNRFDATFKGMLGKIEEHIQENMSKLRKLADQLDDVKQTFTAQIEIAEQLASNADGKNTAANWIGLASFVGLNGLFLSKLF